MEQVPAYREFVLATGHAPERITRCNEIPFLPVSIFKTHPVTDQSVLPELFFTSSGTTGQVPSKHFIADAELYRESLTRGFYHFYGDPGQYEILALVPDEQERPYASLGYMIRELIRSGNHMHSGFYMRNPEYLTELLESRNARQEKIFIPGVTYALLDFFSSNPMKLPGVIIMETGGMKGRGKEMVRMELHERLKALTGCDEIHSEYGMCELLSQAYAKKDGVFSCPPWMKIKVRDPHDPFGQSNPAETGIIRVIDLANIHSCCFIETQDLGRTTAGGEFEILGREDYSEWRGCNLMVG
jgi:hypothetical protein